MSAISRLSPEERLETAFDFSLGDPPIIHSMLDPSMDPSERASTASLLHADLARFRSEFVRDAARSASASQISSTSVVGKRYAAQYRGSGERGAGSVVDARCPLRRTGQELIGRRSPLHL